MRLWLPRTSIISPSFLNRLIEGEIGEYLCKTLLAVAVALYANQARAEGSAQRLIVSPQGPYTTILAALSDAQDGDTIEVKPGTYGGPVVVQKSVTLEGIDYPIIENGGQGTVVSLSAPGAVLRGFELRGSGSEPDQDHSGIIITAPHVTAENNRLIDVLFGIFVSRAPDTVVRANSVTSKQVYEIGRKGDAIRLWSSPRTIVEDNHIYDSRDLVIWYSTDVQIRGNTVERGRYGIHLMYCDGAQIESNRILDNSVGIYTMYSNNITLRENLIRGQRGPSGYALGFKDADNVEVSNNVLVDNRAGIYMDGMPFSPEGYGHIRENVIAFNDVALLMLPAVRGTIIEKNTFWENVEQVSIAGGGSLGTNKFQGNYWSDYTGFDANRDGVGDIPYAAENLFEGLTDREPMLRMLIYSPAQQAIEFASAAFPVMRPKPKFSDPAPSLQPLPLPPFAANRPGNAGTMTLAALALLGLSGTFGVMAMQSKNGTHSNHSPNKALATNEHG
ncbi:MAG TPA: nitrous oxide reductase family maturation protein NosD, partial [Anaerolineae bacterium]